MYLLLIQLYEIRIQSFSGQGILVCCGTHLLLIRPSHTGHSRTLRLRGHLDTEVNTTKICIDVDK